VLAQYGDRAIDLDLLAKYDGRNFIRLHRQRPIVDVLRAAELELSASRA